jgi:hypothetical protein
MEAREMTNRNSEYGKRWHGSEITPTGRIDRMDAVSPYPRSMKYPVRTICGSMRYKELMLDVAQSQTASGVIILMPFVADYTDGIPADDHKQMLDDMHFSKIDMSESIIVVGSDIGESTAGEIEYARFTKKEVYYWDSQLSALSFSHT